VQVVDEILRMIIYVGGVLASFTVVLMIIGVLFPPRKFKKTDKQYTYCVMIAARNEERVIGQLIESIKRQDYPQDKIAIFVCADNCTDKTAQVARDAGAIVYEREPSKKREFKSQGKALDYLLSCIKRDYERGIETWDGVMSFDADNLLASNFFTEYNKAFNDTRFDYYNCYINSSNWQSNLISSYCSCLNCAGPTLYNTKPKAILGLSHPARGRGALYRTYMLRHGWKWQRITIDWDSSAEFISKGYRSCYCEAAELFEEQPITMKIMMRQRMRYIKGHFRVFCMRWWQLLLGIFIPIDWGKKKYRPKEQKPKFSLAAEVQKRVSCYMLFVSIFPLALLTFCYGLLYPLGVLIYGLFTPGYDVTFALTTVGLYYLTLIIKEIVVQSVTVARNFKNVRIHPLRALFYVFVWPFYAILIQFVGVYAILTPVKWKKIPHVIGTTIDNVYQDQKTMKQYLTDRRAVDD